VERGARLFVCVSLAGVDQELLELFRREVERQRRFALIAANNMVEALEERAQDRFWYSIQAFLVAVANVSKLLWGRNEEMAERRVDLRQSLSVNDNSVLQSRTMRNSFEHFNERLERWVEESGPGMVVDSNVMPRGAIAGLDAENYLRNFDPNSWTLIFRDETFELRPLIQAVNQVVYTLGNFQ